MKILFLLSVLLCVQAQASWHYNANSGIGIYQPEGWSARVEGRSALLKGPEEGSAQSEIFLGSDWQSQVGTVAELKEYVKAETGAWNPRALEISGLSGFQTGNALKGAI